MSMKFKKIVFVVGLLLVITGVSLFIYLGYYTRTWADDWCYNADFRNLGFWETLRGYVYNVTYTPSRYSVTIFSGLIYAFGLLGMQLMTPLTIIFWVAGLAYLFYNVGLLVGWQLSKWLVVMAASGIVYFSIYLSPHIYQSMYWRTGTLTYVTPLVFIPWVFVLITMQGQREKPSGWLTTLTFFLALLGGGFSEASCTVLVSTLAMYTLIAGIGYHQNQPWARKTLFPAVLALMGALTAMAMLVLAPTTQVRKERYGEPARLVELLVLLYNFTYAFFILSVKDFQNILIIMISIFSGFLFFPAQIKIDKPVNLLVIAALVGLFSILMVAASFTPSAYIERGLPADRTMIIPRFLAVLSFVVPGWLTGLALREMFAPNWLQTLVAIALLMAFAYPLYSLIVTAEKIPVYAQRAEAWDARESDIQAALAADEQRVDVTAIDGLPVGGIRDFDPPEKKGFWITKCAMDYYGLTLRVHFP